MDLRSKIQNLSERHSRFIDVTSATVGKKFGEKYGNRASSLIKNVLSLISSFVFLTLAGILFVPLMFIEASISFFRFIASIELFNTILDAALTYIVLSIECILMFWGYKTGDEKPYIFQTLITKIRDSASHPYVKLNGHSKGHKK